PTPSARTSARGRQPGPRQRAGERRVPGSDPARERISMLLPTSLVGSYAQPDWLIDREKLAGRFPPRTRVKELWRVPEQWLDQAWDDATIMAIAEQERAGLDVV